MFIYYLFSVCLIIMYSNLFYILLHNIFLYMPYLFIYMTQGVVAMPLIPVLRSRGRHSSELKVYRMVYRESSRTARATQRNHFQREKKRKESKTTAKEERQKKMVAFLF